MILEVFSKLSDCIDLRCCVKLRILLQSSSGEYEAVGSGRAFGRGPAADSLWTAQAAETQTAGMDSRVDAP